MIKKSYKRTKRKLHKSVGKTNIKHINLENSKYRSIIMNITLAIFQTDVKQKFCVRLLSSNID